MLKIIFLSIISLVFIACGSESSSTASLPQNSTKLTISKAPTSAVVSIFQTFSLAVSSKLDQTTVNESTVYIKDSLGTIIESEVVLEIPDNLKITVTPYQYLEPSSSYTLVVTTGLKNELGQSLSQNYEYTFTTLADSSNPGTQINLIKTSPENAITAPGKAYIAFEFDRFIAPSDIKPFTITDLNTSLDISGEIKYFNSSILYKPYTDMPVGHDIEVVFDGNPTDMYGNGFNPTSLGTFTFTVEPLIGNGGYVEDIQKRLTTNKISQKIRYVGFENVYEHIAVAREGGVDIYRYNGELQEWDSTTPYYTLNIASDITEMVYSSSINNEFLLISTAQNGIFVVDVTDKLNITSKQYMQNVGFIYGIGSSQSNGFIDRVYAVGPNIGMYVFSSDAVGNLTQINSVSVAGEPLKVTSSYDNSYVLLSDYNNGVRYYDRNGTSPGLVSISTPVKHIIDFFNTGTTNGEVLVTDSLGYSYSTSTDVNPLNPMNPFVTLFSNIEDILDLSSIQYMCFSLNDNGLYCHYYGVSAGADFHIDKPGIISAAQYVGTFVTLTKDGIIDVY